MRQNARLFSGLITGIVRPCLTAPGCGSGRDGCSIIVVPITRRLQGQWFVRLNGASVRSPLRPRLDGKRN